jgi:hypothetical protein
MGTRIRSSRKYRIYPVKYFLAVLRKGQDTRNLEVVVFIQPGELIMIGIGGDAMDRRNNLVGRPACVLQCTCLKSTFRSRKSAGRGGAIPSCVAFGVPTIGGPRRPLK